MERLSFRNGIQFAWDSTSLNTLMECPRKYQYSLLMGRSPRSESVHLTFGIHYHKGLEIYDHLRAPEGDAHSGKVGMDHDEAVHVMVREMLRATAGWKSDDAYKNRPFLIRSLVWYVDQFKDDEAQTVILANGKPAVELSFRFALPNIKLDGEEYLYCGHLDALKTYMGKTWVFDRKSSKSPADASKWRPNNQMTGYTVGAKISYHQPVEGVIIDAAQILVGGTRFQRFPSQRSQGELDEWFDNVEHHIKMAEGYAKVDFWPMNYSACGNYGGCPFRPVCSKPPAQRDLWLRADYVERVWDPLAVRGDI